MWTGGCPLTEVLIGARNDEGLCTYGDCSNVDRFGQCRRGANVCGPTPARDDGYYAERLPNGSGYDGPARSSALSFGMWATCRTNPRPSWNRGPGYCELPPLRAPNGFEQRSERGEPSDRMIEAFGGRISLNRDECFYLDATFCGGALASASESPAKARRRTVKHSPPHPQMLFPASTPHSSPPTSSPLCRVACKAACRECYDFTAVLLKQAGHILGLGSLDKIEPIITLKPGRSGPKGRTTTSRHRVDQTRGR